MKTKNFFLGALTAITIIAVLSFIHPVFENTATVFTTQSLGVDKDNNERFLYTGFSYQELPIARKETDIMLFIDTGQWWRSDSGTWVLMQK